ncbi:MULTISPECIES: TlpA family protein disulfide reductase [Chitinophagaceae]
MNKSIYHIPFWENLKAKQNFKNKHQFMNLDSVLTDEFKKQNAFLELYVKHNRVSPAYEKYMKDYFRILNKGTRLYSIGIEQNMYLNDSCREALIAIKSFAMDSLLSHNDYASYILRYNYCKYKYINEKHNFFDSVYTFIKSNMKDIKMKEILLFLTVKEALINNQNPHIWYVNDFLSNSLFIIYKDYINNIIEDKAITNNGNSTILLQNVNGRKMVLNSLIKSLNGNLVYIDVWASWCIPCRHEIPFSRNLKQKYKNLPIKFIYLSIDKTQNEWKIACKQELIENEASYRISGTVYQSFLDKQFNIKTIPHYILLGKDGKIISTNAPRPSDKALQDLIDKNL